MYGLYQQKRSFQLIAMNVKQNTNIKKSTVFIPTVMVVKAFLIADTTPDVIFSVVDDLLQPMT